MPDMEPPPIEDAPTSIAAILGEAESGPDQPVAVASHAQFLGLFGTGGPFLSDAVRGYFDNGGQRAFIGRLAGADGLARSLAALEAPDFDEVALVAAPGLIAPDEAGAIAAHCTAHRRFAVLDGPRADPATLDPQAGRRSPDAALYLPWLEVGVPGGRRKTVPPSGHVLGIYARTDGSRGVWKAPANEVVIGAVGLEHQISGAVQDRLNAGGLNTIRRFAGQGIRVWGARTRSADPEWKYVSVRRLFRFLERSLGEGTQWVVFEPNGEPLWAAVVGQIEQFLRRQWAAGALRGIKPQEAYYVRCDRNTMTQDDVDSGRLIAEIGFAPSRPAEFVVFRIGQWTADAKP